MPVLKYVIGRYLLSDLLSMYIIIISQVKAFQKDLTELKRPNPTVEGSVWIFLQDPESRHYTNKHTPPGKAHAPSNNLSHRNTWKRCN